MRSRQLRSSSSSSCRPFAVSLARDLILCEDLPRNGFHVMMCNCTA
jgi:hypothetical protein